MLPSMSQQVRVAASLPSVYETTCGMPFASREDVKLETK